MNAKLNKTLASMLATPFIVSVLASSVYAADYDGESYGQTALTAQALSVQSCTPGINAVSRQIETGSTDIVGLLPFTRIYQSALQLGLNPAYRSDDAKRLEAASASASIEGRALMGAGWSHNYDYRLIAIGIRAYSLYLPGSLYPLVFAQQADGSIRPSDANLGSVSQDTEYKISDPSNGKTITITINGTEITFISLSGQRGLIQDFQATKIKYPGGKVIDMTYSNIIRNGTVGPYVLTGVSDNLGNSLKINRINLNGADTSTLGIQKQGSISSVETTGNPLNNQTASYSYDIQTIVINGSNRDVTKLTQVLSTVNAKENYIYANYNHTGLFSDSGATTRGVQIPLLSEYKKADQTIMKWSATADSLTSNAPNIFSASIRYVESPSNGQLTIAPPGISGTEVYSVTNGFTNLPNINVPGSVNGNNARYVEYLTTSSTPCLTAGGVPLKRFVFEKTNRTLVSLTDKKNNRTDYQYDASNRLLEKTEAKGSTKARKTTLTYQTQYAVPNTIVRGDLTVTNEVNTTNGQVDSKTLTSTQPDSIAKKTAYTFYANGLLKTEDGPRTGTVDLITYGYDSYGNKKSVSQKVNGVTRTTQFLDYNSLGQPERIVYPKGTSSTKLLIDQFVYDTDGTLKSKTTGIGSVTSTITGLTTSYTYNDLKQLETTTNPDGETTSYTYDLMGRVKTVTAPDGSVVRNTYFGNGVRSLEQLTDATGTIIYTQKSQTLDANGRPLRIQSGNNADWYWKDNSYDLNGNLETSTSRLARVEKWGYDELNRVTSHTDPLNSVDTKNYDAQDNTILAKDALLAGSDPLTYRNGNVLTKEVNTDFGTKTYGYNEADQLNQSLYGERQCDYLNIDEIGRNGRIRCAKTTGTSSTSVYANDRTFTYDSTRYGRLDSVTSTGYGVDTAYGYDNYDRVISKAQTNKALAVWGLTQNTLTTNYAYSNDGKLKSITLPSGRKVTYTYDAANKGQLDKVSVGSATLLSTFVYNTGGQMTGWTWGTASGGYNWIFDTTLNGVIKRITNTNSANAINYRLTYSFDRDGRIIKLLRNDGTADIFTYYKDNRLWTETRNDGTADISSITYTYDKNGNRKSLVATGAHQQPAANVAYGYTGNKLSTWTKDGTAQTVTHTANNELTLPGLASAYDFSGMLRFLTPANNDDQRYMIYNHKNERTLVSKKGGGWGPNSIQFVYDENNHLIGEYDSAGVVKYEYVWLGDKPVAVIVGSGSSAKTYYIVTDASNTPHRLIDATNDATVWAWDNTAFGVNAPSTQTVTFNLRFPGQYYDDNSKLHYNLNRYYSPELGRYLEPDPIGLEGGLNLYDYAGANPISNIDPNGLDDFVFYYVNSKSDPSRSFEKAAFTTQGLSNTPVHFYPVTTETGFKLAWEQIVSSGTLIDSLKIFSHSGQDKYNTSSLFFAPDQKNDGKLTYKEVLSLGKANFSQKAFIDLLGCNSGKGDYSVARAFSESQNVNTTGQMGYAYFSQSEKSYIPITSSTQQMYLGAFGRGKNDILSHFFVDNPSAIPSKTFSRGNK